MTQLAQGVLIMRKFMIAAALIGSAADGAQLHYDPLAAYGPNPSHHIVMLGYNSATCAEAADLKANPNQEAIKLYTLGIWTGLNMGFDAPTGRSTDADGIWNAIKLYCAKNPSVTLSNATVEVYHQFNTAGR